MGEICPFCLRTEDCSAYWLCSFESTDFVFRKARYSNEGNLHTLERTKRFSVEVRDLKLNIANNSRRNRDEINGVFDRQAVRSNANHQRNMERIRSDWQICLEIVIENSTTKRKDNRIQTTEETKLVTVNWIISIALMFL